MFNKRLFRDAGGLSRVGFVLNSHLVLERPVVTIPLFRGFHFSFPLKTTYLGISVLASWQKVAYIRVPHPQAALANEPEGTSTRRL